jgi:predicted ATPase
MDPHGPPPSLLDRDREMEIVRGLLAQVRSRSPAAIFVEGEPGIGKSSLFAAALREATGFAVFTAFSQELLKDRPFAPLAEALRIDPRSKDPRRAEVAGLLRAGDGRGPPAPGPELRFQIVDAIVGLVEQAATRGPVLLGLEDIHWADDATLLTLDRLIRETRGLPLMVMSTLRPAPHIQALERLIARSSVSATRVELGPLGREAIVVLANALAGAPPGPRLMDVVSEAGGNPLFVHELIGTMRDEGAISIQSGRAEVSMISMPPPLRMTIIHHLAALPSETAALLRTASILGSSLLPI